MEKKLWFKRKIYGWGWRPVTWEGWIAVVGFILLFLGGELFFIEQIKIAQSTPLIAGFFIYGIALMAGLIALCYWRGEKPRWQWGERNTDES